MLRTSLCDFFKPPASCSLDILAGLARISLSPCRLRLRGVLQPMSYCRGSTFEARPLPGLKNKQPSSIPSAAKAKVKAAPVVLQIPRDNFINEDVWNAAFGGDLERLQYLLTEGLHPTLRPDLAALFASQSDEFSSNTADHASAGKRRALQLLVRRGRPLDGATPLFAAAAGGHCSAITYLIDRGANPQQPRHDGATPFFIACLMNHLPAAQLLARAAGPEVALTTPTMDACTPLPAAANRGHLHVCVFLVDLARSTLSRPAFEKLLRAHSVNGSTAIETSRRRGHEKIAAFLEWNLEVPGVFNHYESVNKGSIISRGTCGLQAKVENAGKWAHELDNSGSEAVYPADYSFDVYTNKKLPLHHRHEESAGFSNGARKPKPRTPGGCCTTLNIFEVLSKDPNPGDNQDNHRAVHSQNRRYEGESRSNCSEEENARRSYDHGSAESPAAAAASVALKRAKKNEAEAHVQMVAGRLAAAAELFADACDIYVAQARNTASGGKESASVSVPSREGNGASRRHDSDYHRKKLCEKPCSSSKFADELDGAPVGGASPGNDRAGNDHGQSVFPPPSPSSVGALLCQSGCWEDDSRAEQEGRGEREEVGCNASNENNFPSRPRSEKACRNHHHQRVSFEEKPFSSVKSSSPFSRPPSATKSQSFTAASAQRRATALSSLASVSLGTGRCSAVKLSAYDLEMRAAQSKATSQATRENAAAGARLCRKMAIHCRRAAGLEKDGDEVQLDCSGLEELLVNNAHL